MTGELTALGDIATGGVLARALEPQAGEVAGGDGHSHEAACLNCGTALVGSHCHECGQRAHVHKTIGAFFHDLLHGVFHFEGKIWRTLPLLAWRPGEVTRQYIDGRRAAYISPIALFLFVVFMTTALFSALGPKHLDGGAVSVRSGKTLDDAEADLARRKAALDAERAAALAKGAPVAAVDARLAEWRDDRTALDAMSGKLTLPTVSGEGDFGTRLAETVNHAIAKARSNPSLMIYKLQSNAYKYSWLLIPLSVPFLWLLFPFSRRFGLYDHTVFVTYSISFMMLLIGAGSLAVYYGAGALLALALLYAPVHMYRQLKGTYALGRAGALWRTAFLAVFAGLTPLLFGAGLVMLTLGG